MKFTRFEDIIAWKKSKELANNIYRLFKKTVIIASKIKFKELLFQL